MRKNFIIILFLLTLILTGFVNSEISKVSGELSSIENNQSIRVVVQFKDVTQPVTRMLTARYMSIPEEKINYKTNKTIFASLSKEEIEELSKMDNVEYLSEEKQYHTLLQESIPLINAVSSWNLQSLGENITGLGQTICIIDTGVNYSHPDLGGCFGNNDNTSICKVIGGWDYCADDVDCTTEDSNPMDLDGHGTHVSGIAAAMGGINGTAIFSKIVMIKAGNGSGTFWDSGIKKAIDWCVNNASKFNISVISMSLGGGLYEDYCDEYSDGDNLPAHSGYSVDLVSSINAAISKNISVIAASGNDQSATRISSPACIQNVTPVGNIQKNDVFYTGFSRNWMVKILVPGVNINSTIISGGYSGNSWTGTSMSTPHVAGAIAIINQYLKSIGQTRTPQEIEQILWSTGKNVVDSQNLSQNFSRIDIYSALMYLDGVAPSVTIISPENNSINATVNQTFVCNTSDWQIKNTTLYLWNYYGLNYTETKNVSGTMNSSEFNVDNLEYGKYEWNCLSFDVNGNSNFAPNNFSLNLGGVFLLLESPINETYVNTNETVFSCSVLTSPDRVIENMTFYIFENETLLNYSSILLSGIKNSTEFDFTFVNETEYVWGCEAYSNRLDYDSVNYTVYYDATTPLINALKESVSTNTVTISWDTDEETNYSISIQNKTNSSFSYNHTLTISDICPSTDYTYNLTFCDKANNCNISSEGFKTLDIPIVTSHSSSGGGGSKTTTIAESQLIFGISKTFRSGEKLDMIINNQTHNLQLNKIINNLINITIRSTPLNIILLTGEEMRLNITSVDYYDLYIKIENASKTTANISIKKINETIKPAIKNIIIENITFSQQNSTENIQKNELDMSEIAILILALMLFIFILISLKRGRINKAKRK